MILFTPRSHRWWQDDGFQSYQTNSPYGLWSIFQTVSQYISLRGASYRFSSYTYSRHFLTSRANILYYSALPSLTTADLRPLTVFFRI